MPPVRKINLKRINAVVHAQKIFGRTHSQSELLEVVNFDRHGKPILPKVTKSDLSSARRRMERRKK